MTPTATPTVSPTITPTQPPPPLGGGGKIAYSSNPNGYSEIFIINPDGTGMTPATNNQDNKNNDKFPVWSPDGTKLAYLSMSNNNTDYAISIFDIQKNKAIPISTPAYYREHYNYDPELKLEPFDYHLEHISWSKDSSRIAYAYVPKEGANYQIYLSNTIDIPHRLESLSSNANYYFPAWSPQENTIAYVTDEDDEDGKGILEIYTVNPDISNDEPERLTNTGAKNTSPNWSPDGKRIAFVSFRNGVKEIYVMDKDGKNEKRFTTDDNNDSPVWSPDGSKIAFLHKINDKWEIYIKNADDGTEKERIVSNLDNDLPPVWSPNSQMIAFVSIRDGKYQIYIKDINTKDEKPINVVDANYPSWYCPSPYCPSLPR